MSVPFIGFDDATAAFYRKVIANVMMNAHAVRMGYFDTLLCETDDPKVARRWRETVPQIAKIMRENNQRKLDEDGR
jgi:hypothetical protein